MAKWSVVLRVDLDGPESKEDAIDEASLIGEYLLEKYLQGFSSVVCVDTLDAYVPEVGGI